MIPRMRPIRCRHSLVALLIACALLAGAPPAAQGQAPDASIRIGLVTDIGQVDDRSFNQSAWEGALIAADALGGTADFVETVDPADYPTNLRLFADQGYAIIVTTGAAISEAVIETARQYPDTHFIAVDADIEGTLEAQGLLPADVPNVTGLIFPEDQAGFLAGVLAARMTRSGRVAAVLPTDQLEPVVNFANGFASGIRYTNPAVQLLSSFHPGGLAVAFEDPVWGAQMAAQAIDQGADVIFAGGGKTGNGGLQEVARRTTPEDPLYCIGVDTDQWYVVPEAQPCLLTSAIKRIREGVELLVMAAAAGEIAPGNFRGEVGLAPFHDFETVVPQEVMFELEAVERDLRNGLLRTDGTRP